MADLASIVSELGPFPAAQKASLQRIFQSLIRDIRFGHPKGEQPDPCQNFGGGFFHGTTPATPGEEFTVQHGFGRVPYLMLSCSMLDLPGSSQPRLTVARAADENRLYFTSAVASASFTIYVEG